MYGNFDATFVLIRIELQNYLPLVCLNPFLHKLRHEALLCLQNPLKLGLHHCNKKIMQI